MQTLVRRDDHDANIWSTLGDAYKMRGNFQSAIKTYRNALDLELNHISAKVQVGFSIRAVRYVTGLIFQYISTLYFFSLMISTFIRKFLVSANSSISSYREI